MVPRTILPEMLAMEENIRGRLTGFRSYDFQNHCFDVDWTMGTWMFTSPNQQRFWRDGTIPRSGGPSKPPYSNVR